MLFQTFGFYFGEGLYFVGPFEWIKNRVRISIIPHPRLDTVTAYPTDRFTPLLIILNFHYTLVW